MNINKISQLVSLVVFLLATNSAYAQNASAVVVVPLESAGPEYTVNPPLTLTGSENNVIGLAETEISQPSQVVSYIIKIRGPVPRRSTEAGVDVVTPFVGQIVMWAGNYPPKGWAFADGQVVVVDDFPELAEVLGDDFGEVGSGLFKLPDLRGRVAVHSGNGVGISNRIHGSSFGAETIGGVD